MGAEEEQGQGVVFLGALVAGSWRYELAGRDPCRSRLFATSACPLAAQLVDESPLRDRDQPRPRVRRDATLGPLACCGEQRFLHGVLADVEPGVAANERAEDLRCEFPQQQVLDICVRQRSLAVMCMMGRTSTAK